MRRKSIDYARYCSLPLSITHEGGSLTFGASLDPQTVDLNSKFYCGICYEYYDLQERDEEGQLVNQVKMLSACGHTFCRDCFQETFRALIEEWNRGATLRCPQTGCDQVATDEEIKRIISEDCYAKYKRFQQDRIVLKDKNLFYCKQPGCEGVLDLRQKSKNVVVCPECSFSYCTKCKLRNHPH